MRSLLRRLLGGVAVLTLAIGCSSKPEMAQVSGTVKFKGQPVPAGWISFTPEPGKGSVRLCYIKDGVYDSSKEGEPGVFPGHNQIIIAGFDGKKIPLWVQGKQIFNPVNDTLDVRPGTMTKDFVIPDLAGQNVRILPTADE